MEYKENSDDDAIVPNDDFLENELDFDEESTTEETPLSTEDAQLTSETGDSKKQKNHTAKDSLKARRAIEDHLERRRLRKELDYLFDDDFVGKNPPDNSTKNS